MKLIPPARQRSAVVNDRQHRLTYGEEPQLATTFDSMHAFRALRKSRKRNGCFCPRMLHRFCPSLCPGLATLELHRITSDNPATQHKKRNSPLESTKTWSVAVDRVVATLGTMFVRGQFASSPTGRDTSRNSSIRRLLHAATMFGQALASGGWTRKKGIGRTSALTTRQSRVLTTTSERRERRDRKGKRFHRRDLVYAECRGSGAPVGSRPHADTGTTVPQISPDGWSAGSGVTNGELCPMPVEGTTSRRN